MSGFKPLNRQPVLTISTKKRVPRPLIEIDGRNYEMSIPSDFTQFKQARALRLQMLVQDINKKNEREWTDDDLQQVEEAMILLVMLIVPKVPRETVEMMNDEERNAIVSVFGQEAERINSESVDFDTALSEVPSLETTSE